MAQQQFSDCVFNQLGETITFLGIPPNSNHTFRVGEKLTGTEFHDDEDHIITRFEMDQDGSPHSIITRKVLKYDPDTGEPTKWSEERPTMVKSYFPNKDGVQKKVWNTRLWGGRNKRGRKSKKYSKTKSKSRTRRGGRRSRRVRRIKRKSKR